MIIIENSRHGEPTARIGSHHLHSIYSPVKESDNIIKAEGLDRYSTFILLEPCLNYLGLLLKQIKPECKIISIYLCKEFYDNDKNISDSKFLLDSDSPDFKTFLLHNLSELDIEGLKIVEWKPSVVYFNKETGLLKSSVGQHIRELYGNITTTSGFGQKLFRNFVKNYISIDNTAIPQQSACPVFIAGSGPGLENDIDFLRKHRKGLILIGLPSSLLYLRYHEIFPDFIISTDPGYYAGIHLSGFYDIPIIAPYTAALPYSAFNNLIIPVNQNYFIEKMLLDNSYSFIQLPSNGTVAGSAVFFSHLISESAIFISGLDFSFIDVLSHIRPHTFDSFIEKDSNRLSPANTLYFDRNIPGTERLSAGRRTSKALRTYSGWFASNSRQLSARCFFLNYHTSPPGCFRSIDHTEAETLLSGHKQISFHPAAGTVKDIRIEKIHNYLSSAVIDSVRMINRCKKTESAAELFNIVNNEHIFNFYLPDLLQFKRHYIHNNGKEVQNKAVSLIEKSIIFLESFLSYVQ